MFLPIIVNVAVLTTAVGFKGTWILTILMALAGAWLVAWEYDRLKPIVFQTRVERPRSIPLQFISVPAFFAIGGGVMAFLWKLIGLGNFSNYLNIGLLLSGVGLVFGIIVAAHYHFMRIGNLDATDEELI